MTTIHYRNHVRASGIDGRALAATARRLMRALGEECASLSLSLVDDASIRELNKEYRRKDAATDVLSFPFRNGTRLRRPERSAAGADSSDRREDLLGDVVISVETARRQAAAYGAPLERELERLLIHGLLHLLGHDHLEAGERRRMEAEERRLAQSIGMPWPYGTARAR